MRGRSCHGKIVDVANPAKRLFPNLLCWALDEDFLGDRMAFIAGPRQIGKTTLLRTYLDEVGHSDRYFNWDIASVRTRARRDPDFFAEGAAAAQFPVVFDELHKLPKWKNYLKGLYDGWKGRIRFIVTGSARLDFARRSGDSLVGRYFLYRRLPLHPRECIAGIDAVPAWVAGSPLTPPPEPAPEFRDATSTLLEITGFPEPFLKGSRRFLERWRTEHLSLLIREDLRDLSRIEQLLRVEELAELLRGRVATPLSTNSLARDLGASFRAVQGWLHGLELVYLAFRIPPFYTRLARALRKEPKLYFWDWSLPESPGARFENFVAVQLCRAVHSWNERGLGRFSLAYIRTRDGIECDFVLLDGRKPVLLVEAKQGDTELSGALLKIRNWLGGVDAIQLVDSPGYLRQHRERGVLVLGLDRFLQLTP